MTTYAKTDYQEDAVLNTARGSAMAAWTPYLALSTTPIVDAGTGITEPSAANGYARLALPLAAPSGGICSNSGALTYTCTNSPWGTVSWVAVYDAVSGGNMRYYGELTTPQVVGVGDQLVFEAGSIKVQEK